MNNLSLIAETFIGKKFIRRSNNPEKGMDCIGLIYFSMMNDPRTSKIGKIIKQESDKILDHKLHKFDIIESILNNVKSKITYSIIDKKSNYHNGDILILKEKKNISHFGIVDKSNKNIIHASFFSQKVIKTYIDSSIRKKIYRILRFNN